MTRLPHIAYMLPLILLTMLASPAFAATIISTSDDGLSLAMIDTATVAGSTVGTTGYTNMGVTVDNADGTLYVIIYSGIGGANANLQQLATLDPGTGAATPIGSPFSTWLTISAAVPAIEVDSDGTIYGGGVDQAFYSINKTTGEITLLGTSSVNLVMDFAFDSSGTLWAVGGVGTNVKLYTLDKSDGAILTSVSVLGPGVAPDDYGVMGIMFSDNDTLYASNLAPDSHLFTINTTTGVATDLGSTGLAWAHGGDICVGPGCSIFTGEAQ